jgi:hypothetical protein
MIAPDRTEEIIGAPDFGSSGVVRRDRCDHGAAGMADDERALVAASARIGDEHVVAAWMAAKAVSVEQAVAEAEALASADEDERHVVLWVRSEAEGRGCPGGRRERLTEREG